MLSRHVGSTLSRLLRQYRRQTYGASAVVLEGGSLVGDLEVATEHRGEDVRRHVARAGGRQAEGVAPVDELLGRGDDDGAGASDGEGAHLQRQQPQQSKEEEEVW